MTNPSDDGSSAPTVGSAAEPCDGEIRSPGRRGFGQVLRTPGVPGLFAAAIVGRMPQTFRSLAILLLVREATGNYTVAGLAVAMSLLVATMLAVPLGRMVDAHGARRVIVPCALFNAGALMTLAIAGLAGWPAWLLVLLAAPTGTDPPIGPTERAVLTGAFVDPERQAAFALDSVLQEVSWTAGPLVGSLALIVAGPPAMLVTAAALALGGSLAFAGGTLVRSRPPRTTGRVRASTVVRSGLVTITGATVLIAMGFGMIEIGISAAAVEFDATRLAGVVLAVWAVGSGVGGIAFGARGDRGGTDVSRLAAGSVICAVAFLPLAAAPSAWWLLPGAFVAGLPIAPLIATVYGAVGHIAPAGIVTEAFAWLGVAFLAGFGASAPIAGALSDHADPRVAIGMAAVPVAFAGVLILIRADSLRAVPRD